MGQSLSQLEANAAYVLASNAPHYPDHRIAFSLVADRVDGPAQFSCVLICRDRADADKRILRVIDGQRLVSGSVVIGWAAA